MRWLITSHLIRTYTVCTATFPICSSEVKDLLMGWCLNYHIYPKNSDRQAWANNADPDMTMYTTAIHLAPFYAPAYSKNCGRALSVTPVRPVRTSVPICVPAITPKPYGIYLWNFTGACMTLRRCVVKKEDNSCLFDFWIICPWLSSIYYSPAAMFFFMHHDGLNWILKEDHQRKISAKLYWNRSSGFW